MAEYAIMYQHLAKLPFATCNSHMNHTLFNLLKSLTWIQCMHRIMPQMKAIKLLTWSPTGNMMKDAEKNHLTDALCFELGKAETKAIRERMIKQLTHVDKGLAAAVAVYLGIHIPEDTESMLNGSIPADADPAEFQPRKAESQVDKSEALSMEHTIKNTVVTRKIAVLVADGVDEASLLGAKSALEAADAIVKLVAPKLCAIKSENDTEFPTMKSFLTTASVLYDAVYVPGGINSVASIAAEPDAIHFLNEAFKHCKPIAADTAAMQVLNETYFAKKIPADFSEENVMRTGIVVGENGGDLSPLFIKAIAQHRFWDREKPDKVPA